MENHRRNFIKKTALLLGAVSVGRVLPPVAPITPNAVYLTHLPSALSAEEIFRLYRETGNLFYADHG